MDNKENTSSQSEDTHENPIMVNCIVSRMVMEDGLKVGFMYREEPDNGADSGWRFLSGTETQKYVDNSKNSIEVAIGVVGNLDPAILNHLDQPFGTDLERIPGTDDFRKI